MINRAGKGSVPGVTGTNSLRKRVSSFIVSSVMEDGKGTSLCI